MHFELKSHCPVLVLTLEKYYLPSGREEASVIFPRNTHYWIRIYGRKNQRGWESTITNSEKFFSELETGFEPCSRSDALTTELQITGDSIGEQGSSCGLWLRTASRSHRQYGLWCILFFFYIKETNFGAEAQCSYFLGAIWGWKRS